MTVSLSNFRRMFSREMDFPTLTACPLYNSEQYLTLKPSDVEQNTMASLEDLFVSLHMNGANSKSIVTRVVFPKIFSLFPNSCVRVTPEGPMKPGLYNPVSVFAHGE